LDGSQQRRRAVRSYDGRARSGAAEIAHDLALDPLREMAQWKDFGRAWYSLVILGRISGIEESRLEYLNPPMIPEILRAAQ
jgi:hypothetical protein